MIKKPAAAMVVLLFLSACGAAAPAASMTPAAASMPSATVQPSTPSPSQQPHASESPGAPAVPPGSVAIVIVDELRVRDAPSLSAGVVGRLARSDQVFVTDSPRTQADGLTWMYVQGAWLEDGAGSGGLGFVALGDESGPFLRPTEVSCPSMPTDIAGLAALTPWERLVCFGSQPLTLTGYDDPENYGFGGLCNCVAEPEWLLHPFAFRLLSPSSNQQHPWLSVRLAPGVEAMWPAVPGEALQLTGHFDDPHSGSCELWGPDPDLQPGVPPTFEDKASVVLICREQFVVTDVTVAVGS